MQETDLGLGTTYERFAVYRWLADLASSYSIQAALEGPGDGIAGIPGLNSLPFGRQGIDVLVVLEDEAALELSRRGWQSQGCIERARFLCSPGDRLPAADGRFDLVWNFNRLPFCEPRALIADMVRVSRRYVALVVPNRWNYGFPARRLYHRRTGLPWPYGDASVMDRHTVRNLLHEAGLRVLEMRWLDVPWWPDVIDLREWLAEMIPGVRRIISPEKTNEYSWTPEYLPYFDPVTHADLHRRIHRLSWLEQIRPAALQIPFAHHFAVIAEKGDGDG
jgi:hypothetical protein